MKTTKTVSVSEGFKNALVNSLDDSNDSMDISKAGIFDLCDALSGMDNSKFSVDAAKEEMTKRGV